MTEATPLASEQITQEDRDLEAWFLRRMTGSAWEGHVARLLARHRIAALSATPAPSGQDASQAQGEVERLTEPYKHHHGPLPDFDSPIACVFDAGVQYAVELLAKELGVTDWTACDGTEEYDGDLGGTLMNIVREAMPLNSDGERLWPSEVVAALSPAPGATAQDGVVGNDKAWELSWRIDRIREDGGPLTESDKGFLVEAVNWMRALPATPTPTIPAGMVAVPVEPTEAMWEAFDAWNGDKRTGYETWRKAWADMLAAAPKQAEQQGVDYRTALATALFEARYGMTLCMWSDETRDYWLARADEALAALNAPTGAVEKGEAM